MRVQLAAFGLSLVSAAFGATVAAQAGTPVQTTLHGDSAGCLTQRALDKRIVHYLSSTAQVIPDLQVRVRAPDTGTTEFELEQAGNPLAVRRFETLPKACADRLNAIALAIAVAVEQAAHSRGSADLEGSPRAEPAAAVGAVVAPAAAPVAAAPVAAAVGVGVAAPVALSRTTGPAPARAPETPVKPAPAPEPEAQVESQVDEVAPASDPPPPNASAAPAAEPRDAAPETAEAESVADGAPTVLQLSLQAGGGVIFQVLPEPAPMGVVGGELSFGDVGSVRLSAILTTETRTDFEGGQAVVQLIGGRGLFCWRAPFAWFALHPCLGAIGGAFLAEGQHYDPGGSAQWFWLAALGRFGFRLFDSAPVAVELGAEIYANVVRPFLAIDGSQRVLETPYIGGSGGLEIIFSLF